MKLASGAGARSEAARSRTARRYVVWFDDSEAAIVELVGGKNASLARLRHELRDVGIRVPDGFAVTARAYWHFVEANGLRQPVTDALEAMDRGDASLHETGELIRGMLLGADMPDDLASEIAEAYEQLAQATGRAGLDVAVRSSATAEDLPEASFAGQQDSFLNIAGAAAVVDACQRCFASLFTDRAISYREANGFDHMRVALSAGVQQMVRSDAGAAGVMFTLDTETGFPGVVVIDGSWGLGEAVVKGIVDPDEFVVFKPLLDGSHRPILSRRLGSKLCSIVYDPQGGTQQVPVEPGRRDRWVIDDAQVLQLARWAVAIERAYERPMDIEWALDGPTGELYVVQARPETVRSRESRAAARTYRLAGEHGPLLASGMAIGTAIASGPVCVLERPEQVDDFPAGAVLVTGSTDPDWVPAMRRAAAIVTEHGGRTSHAAIVSRELGVPAVVGAEGATSALAGVEPVTVDCAEGEVGMVYEGVTDVEVTELDPRSLPRTRTPVMLNVGSPAAAFGSWHLPARGIGLARMEFVVGSDIGVHPMALLQPERLDEAEGAEIAGRSAGYPSAEAFFVERLASGISRIAAAHHPEPVIVRLSDFKTNEYRNLVGGRHFEPEEENPMIGWRGASRYASPGYRAGFALECQAIRMVRNEIGLDNVAVMVPFCRTLGEADAVLEELRRNGLERGVDGLVVHVMAEIPANVLCAREFATRFDGFSIGSNDLTQLVLGIDRDSERLAHLYDERNPAVIRALRMLLDEAHAAGRHVGFCGDAPSADPSFARLLVELGIDSISVSPPSFAAVVAAVDEAERHASST